MACERGEQPALAEELFAICASTDANYVTSSAFAMARIRLARGDEDGTLAALSLVPATSRGYTDARKAHAKLLLQRDGGSMSDLASAWESIHEASLDPISAANLEVEVLEHALQLVKQNKASSNFLFAGEPATERNLRPKLEKVYRDLAMWSRDDEERRRLITQADQTRRWSLL